MRAADLSRAGRNLAGAVRLAVRQARGHDMPWEPGFDHRPRPCPPGLECGPPDFVGIGAQKAGTTWWFSVIAAHPRIYHHPPFHKERHFLSALGAYGCPDDDRLYDYGGWFPRPRGALTGEWTPDYLPQYWVPPLLAEAAPHAKLLVLLRDPIERYRSGLAHAAANGDAGRPAAAQDAFARGLYGEQLARWEPLFGPEQLLVLQYEQVRTDPRRHLAATLRFLGVDDGWAPPSFDTGGEGSAKPPLPSRHRHMLRDLYASDVAALAGRYPQLDLELWPDFSDRGRISPRS